MSNITEFRVFSGKMLEHNINLLEVDSIKDKLDDLLLNTLTIDEINYNVVYCGNKTTVIIDGKYTGIAFCHPLDEFKELEGFKYAFKRALIQKLLYETQSK